MYLYVSLLNLVENNRWNRYKDREEEVNMGENKLIMARNGKYAMYNGVALEVADSLCAQGCVGKSVVVYTSLLNEKIGIEVCVDTKQVTISRYRQFKDIMPYFRSTRDLDDIRADFNRFSYKEELNLLLSEITDEKFKEAYLK